MKILILSILILTSAIAFAQNSTILHIKVKIPTVRDCGDNQLGYETKTVTLVPVFTRNRGGKLGLYIKWNKKFYTVDEVKKLWRKNKYHYRIKYAKQ